MNSKGLGVALVTRASAGIGKATAQALARAGNQVCGTSRWAAATPSPGINMLVCDVTSDESLDHELRTFGIGAALVKPSFTRIALEENAVQPDRISSAHEKGRTAMNTIWRNGIAASDPVEAVADAVGKTATDKTPKHRDTPGKTAGQFRFMRRFIPEKAFEKSFRKQMNLPA